MRAHLVEAGLAEAAAEGRVAGPGQGERPLCPVPLELTSLSINIYREADEGRWSKTEADEEKGKEGK